MQSDPYQVVRQFEQAVAEFAGAKYGIATDSCTSAIFLSLLWSFKVNPKIAVVEVPRLTYPSVPMSVVHAGRCIKWINWDWKGCYRLNPTRVVDCAKRFKRGLFLNWPECFYCLSFHSKKLLPIGRGGMILTNDAEAASWLRMMRFDGREECSLSQQKEWPVCGWNCYLQPEQAARGLTLLANTPDDLPDQIEDPPYPDCSKMECFKEFTV